jgi:hypothetical protein
MNDQDQLNKELQESLRKSIQQMFSSGSCPVCGSGKLIKMDAGARGTSFAEGNLLGAFIKSHRCNSCGYTA